MIFTKAILEGRPIDVYNGGRMQRDFTYVDDIVEGVVRVLARAPAPDADRAPYAIYNIGNHEAVELDRFIATLEKLLGRRAIRRELPMQPGGRAGDVRVDRRPRRAHRLCAEHAARARARALRRVVPRLLRDACARLLNSAAFEKRLS